MGMEWLWAWVWWLLEGHILMTAAAAVATQQQHKICVASSTNSHLINKIITLAIKIINHIEGYLLPLSRLSNSSKGTKNTTTTQKLFSSSLFTTTCWRPVDKLFPPLLSPFCAPFFRFASLTYMNYNSWHPSSCCNSIPKIVTTHKV